MILGQKYISQDFTREIYYTRIYLRNVLEMVRPEKCIGQLFNIVMEGKWIYDIDTLVIILLQKCIRDNFNFEIDLK